jgi:uncharacterized protein
MPQVVFRFRIFVLACGVVLSASAQAPGQQAPPGPEGRGGFGPGRGGGRGGGGQLSGPAQNPSIDTVAPELPPDLKSGGVLIFSKTNGWRDEPAIQASDAALAVIAKERGWPYFVTENGAVMNPEQLAKFKLVIWNNTSGDSLSEQQRTAFQSWLENGGSALGIHGAGGDPAEWPHPMTVSVWKWYIDTFLGTQFKVHSSIMPGDIHIEDPKSPITKGLPAVWHRSEEWYSFVDNPRKAGFHILATVDEKSYTPGAATMVPDHPLVWWHCVGKGHVVYSALGHAGRFLCRAPDDTAPRQRNDLGAESIRALLLQWKLAITGAFVSGTTIESERS